jgi:hypothetical protein
MAHFARLSDSNTVMEVLVVDNDVLINPATELEEEATGVQYLSNIFGGANWVQTSYNSNFRKNYASLGGVYDKTRNAFIAPQPFFSWLLNDETCTWEAPVPMPVVLEGSNDLYLWDENNLRWTLKE